MAAISGGWPLLGAVLYTAAFNHKQMALLYAPAFFAHLLGRSLQSAHPMRRVAALGLAVLATMLLLWWPFLRQPGPLAVAARLAPLGRGVFEDYVASFWCVTSPLVKWRQRFAAPVLARAAIALSLAGCAPAMAQQIMRPSRAGLLYAMLNCAFSAFLFGFQVHEKTILFPLLPAALLARRELRLLRVLGPLAALSMYPLLRFERLSAAYAVCIAAAVVILGGGPPGDGAADTTAPPELLSARSFTAWAAVAAVGGAALHAAYLWVPAPTWAPHAHALALSAFCAAHFGAAAVYANARQWQLPAEEEPRAAAGRVTRKAARKAA